MSGPSGRPHREFCLAKKPSVPPVPKVPLEIIGSRDDAKSRIQDRIDKGSALKKKPIGSPAECEAVRNDFYKWDSYNAELLKQVFTSDQMSTEYSAWGVFVLGGGEKSLGEKIKEVHGYIDDKIHRLDSINERLEIIPLNAASQDMPPQLLPPKTTNSRKVFIVHGRDEIAKSSLEIFLHENKFDPVVLHRQADEGLTVIEKFEKHSDVGYAFILLTPDEIAYLASEEKLPDVDRRKEFRARPNVIFEFGYFVGKLGRGRVCCLYTGNVSLPSDVSGMIYKKYDKAIEEVGYSILKDLKAAGY